MSLHSNSITADPVTFSLVISCCILSVCGQTCDTSHSCIGQKFTNTSLMDIDGYKAAYGASSSWSGAGIECSGSFSCHSIAFLNADSSYIKCKGSYSCCNTTIESVNQTPIYCFGAYSCIGSNITTISNQWMDCDGYQSCAYSYIYGVEVLDANGYLALYNTIIDTVDTVPWVGNITVRLDTPFAGFGAKLFCRKNHTCNIQCNSINACTMFYIHCEGTCIIDKSSDDIIAPIFVYNYTEFTYIIANITSTNYTLFESEKPIANDESCTNAQYTFDDRDQQQYKNITITEENEGSLCCRGYESCANNVIQFETARKRDLLCSGSRACEFSYIKGNDNSIYCDGFKSCLGSHIINAFDIYCSSYRSCQYATIAKSRFISCSGRSSCKYSVLISDGVDMNIYFVGKSAGLYVMVYCNVTDICNVYCMGVGVCSYNYTKVYCNGSCTIECDDATSVCAQIIDATTQYPTVNPSEMPSLLPSLASVLYSTEDLVVSTDTVSTYVSASLYICIIGFSLVCVLCIVSVLKRIYKQRVIQKRVQKMSDIVSGDDVKVDNNKNDAEGVPNNNRDNQEEELKVTIEGDREEKNDEANKDDIQELWLQMTVEGHEVVNVARNIERHSESGDSDHNNDDLWLGPQECDKDRQITTAIDCTVKDPPKTVSDGFFEA